MFKTSMASDFFNIKGLETRTGLSSYYWNLAILKELTDNALDAIEPKSKKEIEIFTYNNVFKIFDNGNGFSNDDVMMIYDFDNYVSINRHKITASRGKQGNGLKSIIGMCYVKDYTLLWHTNNGTILQAVFDASQIQDKDLEVTFKEVGTTDKHGIEIIGFNYNDDEQVDCVVGEYSVCNPDVNFKLDLQGSSKLYKATIDSINHTQETSLGFYSFNDFKRLVLVQDPAITYKSFLETYFGTRVANSSKIKSKIKDLNLLETDAIKSDFENLKSTLKNKPYTLLKKHLLGFEHIIETFIKMESTSTNKDETTFPCLVELNVSRLKQKLDKTVINCYVNNSITYSDGYSIRFKGDKYKISNTRNPIFAYNLQKLLECYSEYMFEIHIIAPYLKFKDYGKTEIDISDFINELVAELKKVLNKETKLYNMNDGKKPNQKALAEKYMDEAFMQASSNGKYSITARQIYYKLRELARKDDFEWEKDSTYSQFTQKWLTSWLDVHEEYEDKINFSERGNYYIDGSQSGLGTANVRTLINNTGRAVNQFKLYGGLQENVHISPDFDLIYKYDKALYIEKTGFDAVFKAEKLDEKYNMIIVSGQGFASRAARNLLYHLQQQGLKLFCMHDLDLSGVSIYNSMCQANEKFKFDLDMVNLGILPDDVTKYNIVPEVVAKVDTTALSGLDYNHRIFFNKGDKSQRVELNAFSTEQLLNIIDSKLRNENNLPSIKLSESLQLDNTALREVAFMRILKDKYESQLEGINLPCDLSLYDGKYTVQEAKMAIPEIKEQLIEQYRQEIISKLAI